MRKERTYTVSVLRVGYALRDIEVSATSKNMAREKAEDIAGDFEFNEHSSKYFAEVAHLKETTNEK